MKMKTILFLLVQLIFGFSCKEQNINFQTSVYDNPDLAYNVKSQKDNLKKLDDNKFFTFVHDKLLSTIKEKHQNYFKTKNDYALLYIAKGDLFLNSKEDFAFIVYDKKNIRISIVAYNEMKNEYFELYRNLKVENGLDSADCNYSAFGTLDYQIGGSIEYFEGELIKKPESFFDYTFCKIANISKDGDIAMDYGCFTLRYPKENFLNTNSLIISTCTVYNNWECLKYNKATNSFTIFYGQAFAD